MIRDYFRILKVDLSTGRGQVVTLEGRDQVAGGSGLAALIYQKFGKPASPWNDPEQPLIFAIGPLTGYFPLMSKTVLGFKSPYHDQYAESHAGGRSALALRLADLDALVVTGKATRPSVLTVGSRYLKVREAHYLWGMDVQAVGKYLRRSIPAPGTAVLCASVRPVNRARGWPALMWIPIATSDAWAAAAPWGPRI